MNGRDLARVSLWLSPTTQKSAPQFSFTFIGKHCRSPPARAHLGKPLSPRRLYCSANQIQSLQSLHGVHADLPPFARSRGATAPPALNSSGPRALNCTSANFFSLLALLPLDQQGRKLEPAGMAGFAGTTDKKHSCSRH